MSNFERKVTKTVRTRCLQIGLIAACMAPVGVCADTHLLLLTTNSEAQLQEIKRSPTKSDVNVGLNEKGDFMIRHRETSLIIAYNSAEDYKFKNDTLKNIHLEPPATPGVSITLAFAF